MTEIDLLQAQKRHIDLLQERYDAAQQKLINKFLNTEGWKYFFMRHLTTYERSYGKVNGVELQYAIEDIRNGLFKLKINYSETPEKISLILYRPKCTNHGKSLETKEFGSGELLDFIKDTTDTEIPEMNTTYWSVK